MIGVSYFVSVILILIFVSFLSSASVSNGPRHSTSTNSLSHKHSVLDSSHDSNSNDRWTHASPLARAEDQPRNRQVICVCCLLAPGEGMF